jgi:hypothetical protein
MIDVRSFELSLDQGKVLVLIQGAVMIAICGAKLRDGKAASTELRTIEFTSTMTIQMLKQQLGRALRFVEVDGAVGITI